MSDLIPMLKLTATHLEMDHMATMATAAREAVAEIERLAAENAALRAKVERLTPREMTLERAQAILCEHDYLGMSWRLRSDVKDGSRRYYLVGLHRASGVTREASEQEARYIAQCLERDAKGGD